MILGLIIGAGIGFVIGALVFRNNSKKLEALAAQVSTILEHLKAKV